MFYRRLLGNDDQIVQNGALVPKVSRADVWQSSKLRHLEARGGKCLGEEGFGLDVPRFGERLGVREGEGLKRFAVPVQEKRREGMERE